MKKILLAVMALAFLATPTLAGRHYHHGYHNGGYNNHYHGGHNYYNGGGNKYVQKNYYGGYGGYNNFYQDPNFWGGVAGGLIGGAIINQMNQPRCDWVDTQVYDPSLGAYVFRTVQVCN